MHHQFLRTGICTLELEILNCSLLSLTRMPLLIEKEYYHTTGVRYQIRIWTLYNTNNERELIKLTIFFGKLSKTVKRTIAALILSNLLNEYPSNDLWINKNQEEISSTFWQNNLIFEYPIHKWRPHLIREWNRMGIQSYVLGDLRDQGPFDFTNSGSFVNYNPFVLILISRFCVEKWISWVTLCDDEFEYEWQWQWQRLCLHAILVMLSKICFTFVNNSPLYLNNNRDPQYSQKEAKLYSLETPQCLLFYAHS